MEDSPWDMGRSGPERDFLDRLRHLSGGRPYFDVWHMYPELVITLTIFDTDHEMILRTLRIDFDGRQVRCGNDRNHHIDPHMDRTDLDYFETPLDVSTVELADQAFGWLKKQARRPIERQEWGRLRRRWFQWVLANEPNMPLAAKGLDRPGRPPDRVIRIDPREI